ncbi:MAG TPA: HAMP domain-containing histidine kinase [Arcobacter sp.]|nr:HAMP domain-containing histidine kinase [Arcobacter sp.]
MGEMMDAIAHQWKQPLGAIKINIDSLALKSEMGILEENDIKNMNTKTNAQISHLVNTIDEFRDMLNNNPEKKLIALTKIIKETLLLLKDSMMKFNINFKVVGDDNLKVNIFPIEFKHILINIINNAKDEFVKKDIKNKSILFKYSKKEDFVQLDIIDNAGGIPKKCLNKLFDFNFTTKKSSGGSGMGLYMSKLFADKMDCKIYASSIEDSACFSILIPTTKEQ